MFIELRVENYFFIKIMYLLIMTEIKNRNMCKMTKAKH